ncbi:MAG: hypothetical protein HY069_04135 [Chlamydiia bacterium]|nr:hypothetical protein [Chlamydiia bacterium]
MKDPSPQPISLREPAPDFPAFILFLEIAPDLVDVNVHPQKKEARFSQESALFRQVRAAVETLFATTSFSEPITFAPRPSWSLQEEQSLPMAPAKTEAVAMPMAFPERPLAIWEEYLLLEKEQLILVDLQAAQARIGMKCSSHYTLAEGMEIWKQLQKCQDARYDPKGNLIWKSITAKELGDLLR